MAANKPLDVQAGFTGGWNCKEPLMAPEDSYAAASNLRLNLSGALEPRGQTRRLTAAVIAAAQVQSGFSWRKADASVQQLIHMTNGHLYTANLTNSLTLVTDRGGGLTTSTGGRCCFAHFRDAVGECVYIADGPAGPTKLSKWDGTTFSVHAIGPAVTFSACWVANGRLFAVTALDQVLYFSGLNNGDTLGDATQGGGFLTVRAFGASPLVAGIGLGSSNLLCHGSGISIFRGTTADDITLDLGHLGLAEGIGALGPQAIYKFDTLAYIVTAQGLYLANEGGVVPVEASGRPDPLRRAPLVDGVPAPSPTETVAPFIDATPWFIARHPRFQELWVGAGSVKGMYPPRVYNYELKRWIGTYDLVLPTIHHVRAAWDTVDGGGTKQLLLGCTDGFVRMADFQAGVSLTTPIRDDVLSDGTGGTAFTTSVQCRRMWGGRALPDKVWRALNVMGRLNGNALAVTVSGQGGDSVASSMAQPSSVVNADYGVFRSTALPKSSQYVDVTLAAPSEPPIMLASVELEGEYGAERGK